MKPPVAKLVPHTTEIHGKTLTDPYFWLRERENPEVIDYLKAENAYTEAVMKETEAFQEALYKEMVGRIKETDLSVPYRKGDYFYYTRTEEGKQYSIHCRKKGSLGAEEEIFFDENKEAEGHEYFSLGALSVSSNGKILAYAVDTSGAEKYTLRFRDLTTGEDYPDAIENTATSVVWANDDATVFYTTLDSLMRPYRLHRHTLGTKSTEDALVYEEQDESFFMYAYKTLSSRYIVIYLGNKDTNEVHILDADAPSGAFRVFAPREKTVEYSIDHQEDRFLVRTNWQAKNFRLMEVPTTSESLDKAAWKEVIAHRPEVKLESVTAFKDFLVIGERKAGNELIRVRDVASKEDHYVEFPEEVYALAGANNERYDTDTYRYTYYSLTTPKSVFDYNLKTRERKLLKQTEVLGGFNSDDYVSERIYATAPDGTKVPLSLMYKKDTKLDGKAPCYLYGYGSYGITVDPYFSSVRLSLVDRGFVFAIAHIRGGGFLGETWYEDGKKLTKKNTFTDFIAAADHLVAKDYCARERLVISGGSAGGMLIGTTINLRPDVAAVAVANVPFVDVINTMLDPSLPLTVTEYDEWGNPNEPEFFEYMYSYSPYDNVEAKAYPHLLVLAGLNDPRVQYWEPAKWVAKLRATKTDDNHLLLKTNMGAGHGGASGRYNALRELALEYAFILDRFGLAEKS